jgi:hypothetical protein
MDAIFPFHTGKSIIKIIANYREIHGGSLAQYKGARPPTAVRNAHHKPEQQSNGFYEAKGMMSPARMILSSSRVTA